MSDFLRSLAEAIGAMLGVVLVVIFMMVIMTIIDEDFAERLFADAASPMWVYIFAFLGALIGAKK